MDQYLIQAKDFRLAQLPPRVILLFKIRDFFALREMVQGGKVKKFGPARRFVFESQGKAIAVLGGLMGAALATVVLELALAHGAKELVSLGTGGALWPEPFSIGSLVEPQSGWDQTHLCKDYGLAEELEFSSLRGVQQAGKLVSSNGFFALTQSRLEKLRQAGVDLLDMEASPLAQVARHRGASFYPLLCISNHFHLAGDWHNQVSHPPYLAALEQALFSLQQIEWTQQS